MQKIKEWLSKTGVTNVVYLIIGVISLFMNMNLIAGACFGIFGYINFNVIRKLVEGKEK